MENLCSVTQDLNRRDQEDTIYNLELDSFFDRISAELETIEDTIKELKELAFEYHRSMYKVKNNKQRKYIYLITYFLNCIIIYLAKIYYYGGTDPNGYPSLHS